MIYKQESIIEEKARIYSLVDKIEGIFRSMNFVYYDSQRLDWNPELYFFLRFDCRIFAMRMIMGLSRKTGLSKKYYSSRLYKSIQDYIQVFDKKRSKARSKRLSRKIWKTLLNHNISISDELMRLMDIEMIQVFRMHCCETLDELDNASRRYFYHIPIVYVRDINAYVITNYRKYIYDAKSDSYIFDQTLRYKLIDYCPFCGKNLARLRIDSDNSTQLIEEAILRWRDCAVAMYDIGDEAPCPTSFYNINYYDSCGFIAHVLSKKYCLEFDDLYGVDKEGTIRRGSGVFLNVRSIFSLVKKHDLFKLLNFMEMSGYDAIQYCTNKFDKSEVFTDTEVHEFTFMLNNALNLIHGEKNFNELMGKV